MELISQIESLLFASPKPVSARQLANFGIGSVKKVEETLLELQKEYKDKKRGVAIIQNKNQYQMVSASENSELIQKLTKEEVSGELTRPSLETLTIVAYRGPISKIDIERIRGINCSLILRNLLMRGLVETVFDKQKQETYYNITFDFIRYLGINNVQELPDYDALSKDETIEQILET